MAKRVRVSSDGSTYYTLPGGSGDYNDEAEQIGDTIFGQTFQSEQTGLISWNSSANALFKGFAGYVAKVKQSGTATAATGEAMSLVSGKTYKITDATKNVWSRSNAVTVYDNAVAVNAANIQEINYLFGRVTFVSGYTVTGAITVDIYYLPMTVIAKANSFTLTQTANAIDISDFATVQANNGYRVFEPGLRTVTLEVGGFYDVSSAFWETLEGRSELVLEINPDGSSLSVARGFFKMVNRGQSGDVGALEEETRMFSLAVPENIDTVFSWVHDAATTLSQAVQILLAAFINETMPYIQYLPDDVDNLGFEGQAVVTDVSLSSGLDAMNEFQASFQGSGAPAREVQSE